ncbi:MAG TPA: hypothetical protein DDW65_06910 [Firmicutes bacterium]|nr:hypothetical protein [Bacillota bacterium]
MNFDLRFLGKISFLAIIGLIAISCLLPNLSLAMNPGDILIDIFNRQGLAGKGSFELNLRVVSIQGKENSTSMIKVFFGNGSKQLVTFVMPERLKDDCFLVNGYNTWMYQKGLRRPIRVSAQQKLFGNAGIAETAGINYLDDYDIIKTVETDGEYLMDLKARDQRTAYQLASLWINKDNLQITKIILKAVNGQALKNLHYSNYTLVDGHEVATIEIHNLLQQQDSKTIMEFTAIKSRDYAAEIFDPLMMGKIRL